jgi:hypothetical protein
MKRFVFINNKIPVYMLLIMFAGVGSLIAQDESTISPSEQKPAADTYDEKNDTKEEVKKTEKNPVTKFLFDSTKYLQYDSAKLYTATFTSDIKLQEAKVVVDPATKSAGIQTSYQSSVYVVLFDENTRHAFCSAVKQYLSDFETHILVNKANKTKKVYGEYNAFITYGTISAMMTGEGKPDVFFGYRFKGKSPYFLITINSTPNIRENKATYDIKDSMELQLYMTKSQAEYLSSVLSDDVVNQQLVSCYEETPGSGKTTTGDTY